MTRTEFTFVKIVGDLGGIVATFIAVRVLEFSPAPFPLGDQAVVILWPGSLGIGALFSEHSEATLDAILLFLILTNALLYGVVAALLVWSRKLLLKVTSHA